jgi:hypothetical protein
MVKSLLEPGLTEAARVVVNSPDVMTPQGRRDIATWLRRQAKFLEKHGDEMAKTYMATYWFRKGDVHDNADAR